MGMKAGVRWACVAVLGVGAALLVWDIGQLRGQGALPLSVAATICTSALIGIAFLGLVITFVKEG